MRARTRAEPDTRVRVPCHPRPIRLQPCHDATSTCTALGPGLELAPVRSARWLIVRGRRLGMASRRIVPALAVLAIHALGLAPAAAAEPWPRAYIVALPDWAFAVVHTRPDGTKSRHLLHHDADGRVDVPHLRSALSRLGQVRWKDPADADRARQHLLAHEAVLGLRWRTIPQLGGGPRASTGWRARAEALIPAESPLHSPRAPATRADARGLERQGATATAGPVFSSAWPLQRSRNWHWPRAEVDRRHSPFAEVAGTGKEHVIGGEDRAGSMEVWAILAT